MKPTFKLLLISALSFCSSANALQNIYPVISTSVETACIANCMDADSIPSLDSALISVVMTIQLFEVTGITSLHVKLGTTSGSADLLDKIFDFDVSGSVGNCTYSRTDYTVTLGLGSFTGLTSYFSEVILERDDHSYTDAIVFNR